MGVSFKIAKNGSRFKPKPLVSEAVAPDNVEDASAGSSKIQSKNESNYSATAASAPKHNGRDGDAVGLSGSSLSSRRHISLAEDEVSFVLNLYLDGYSIGKPSDSNGYLASLQDGSKSLLPYDRSSETLFSAIEAGTLPGDVLDDIPCKFMNGTVICEVRDFRKCTTDAGSSVPSADIPPIFTKLRLRMSLENVVKDIPLIADDSWSYGDLMEVESRILKALQPKLCLDPTPRLDRLYENPLSSKISLGLSGLRKRRLMQMPDVTVTTNNRLHGKKICVGQPQEGQSYRVGASGPGDMSSQYAHESLTGQNIGPGEMLSSRVRNVAQDTSMSGMNAMPHPSKFPHGPGSQRTTHDPVSGSVLNPSSSSLPSASGQDVAISYNDSANSNSLPHGKMDAQEALMSQYSNKRTKIAGSLGSDSIHQQPIGSYMDSLQTSDVQWRNQGLAQQANLRGMPYGNTSLQKYPSLARDGSMNQDIASSAPLAHQGLRYGVSGEHVVPEKMDKAEKVRVKNDPQMIEGENNHMDPRFQQRPSPQAFMRPGFHQGGWNIHNQQVEKDSRKEEQIQRRKSAHNSRASAGGIAAQSSLSAKSADMTSGSLGNQYAAVSSPAQHGYSQKSGNMGMPHHAVRSQSVTSSGNNDSMQHQQHQAQVAAKWRSNSLPKTPGMSGVGSPASVSNMSFPMNAASPSVSTPSMADQTILEKFTKIEMVTASHKLHRKRAKADEVSRKLPAFSAREVMIGLANTANIENLKDENCTLPLSRSIIGGSMNTSKIRVLTFMQPDRGVPGVAASSRLRTRLIMSEKPQEGTVAMHFGEIEDKDYLSIEDCLPSLPNTHYADLLASQLSTLMSREGYYMEDHIQPRPPTRPNNPLNNQQNVPGQPSEMQQSGETAPMSGQPANDTRPTTAPVGSPPNAIPNTGGMLSPGNPRGLQSSQGHIPGGSAPMRSQQMGDPNQPISQQQPMQLPNQQQMVQQNPQIQRSVLMPPNSLPQMNTMGPNPSLPMSNPMVNNKSSHLQMQNQPTQPQMQQSQTQRKMMMGLGTAMGMGNLANNMVGLGGLGNMMGIGGVGSRGMPVAGMSSPMGPIPGMGNLAQNPVGISQTSNLSAISQHLRSGALTPAHAQLLNSRMRMNQNRGMLGGPHQPGLAGLSGARNMQPGSPGLSMLGQALNRGSAMNPMQQRTALGMAAPRLMTGMNVHMNPQQQMQQLQQQQQMQQLQQQQQMQQQMQQPQAIPQQAQQQQQPQQLQQQQEASSLQAVLSPQQVSSPSGGGVPQPPVNHLIAQSPQLSSGAVHNPPSNSNVEPVGPGSPQLSSQTLGSVGSITNSHGLTRGEQE